MPHQNETVLRDLYTASAEGDVERIRELLHPDVVWHVPGATPLRGSTRASMRCWASSADSHR